MRCLTLQQPWATLVAIGAKRIETRSRPVSYRGPLAIHSSLNFPGFAKDLLFTDPFFSALQRAGFSPADLLAATAPVQPSEILPLGKVVAVADLVDVVRITEDNVPPEPERSFGNYKPGRYAWHLDNVRALQRPIPARGALGLWRPGAELQEMIAYALKYPAFDGCWPEIDWHCQDCGKLQYYTINQPPWGRGDAENCTCAAGDTMTMVARCGQCGQDLKGGDNLCEHMPQVTPPGE